MEAREEEPLGLQVALQALLDLLQEGADEKPGGRSKNYKNIVHYHVGKLGQEGMLGQELRAKPS